MFELDLLIRKALVEPRCLCVKFLFQLLNKSLSVVMVNVVKLRVDKPILVVLFDETFDRRKLLFDRVIEIDYRL